MSIKSKDLLSNLLKKNTCNNKYDLYRLKNSFDEYIIHYLENDLNVIVDNRFSNINIIGGFICLVAMLYSHFNDLKWPDNYYIVLACVIVYYFFMNSMLLYQYFYEQNAFILFQFNHTPKQFNPLKKTLIRVSSKVQNYKNKYTLTITDYNDFKTTYSVDLMFNHYINDKGVLQHKILLEKFQHSLLQFQSLQSKKKQ